MKLGVLLIAAVLPAGAEVFEWWQTTDAAIFSRGTVSAVIHTQFRMRNHFSDLFQGRFGPVVRAGMTRRLTLIAGYYFGESEVKRDDWQNNHRTFIGIERPVRTERGTLTLRSMAEHHFGGGAPQDRRFRGLLLWSHRAPLSPYWGTETFFDRHGFMSQRIQGGVRHGLTDRYSLDIGYLYDIRRFRAGEHRHVIQTAIRPRR